MNKINIDFKPEACYDDETGSLILAVDKVYVSYQSRQGTVDRRADTTLIAPLGYELRVYLGDELAPTDAITSEQLVELITERLAACETAVKTAEQQEKGGF